MKDFELLTTFSFNMNQHFPPGDLESNIIKKKMPLAAPPMGSPLIVPGKAMITHNEAIKMNSETDWGWQLLPGTA